jgi:hypothetical protein
MGNTRRKWKPIKLANSEGEDFGAVPIIGP